MDATYLFCTSWREAPLFQLLYDAVGPAENLPPRQAQRQVIPAKTSHAI
jgi:hypothetical protein